jgi:hypothetical protein
MLASASRRGDAEAALRAGEGGDRTDRAGADHEDPRLPI